MVKGLPKLDESKQVCADCLMGKQHRDSIPKASNWRSSKRLELVHSDICGPITPASNSNSRYILTFIDDFSKKTWVYFLINKSSALDQFKKFRSMVEKETGNMIVCLRTDRGGEFTSLDFKNYCEENGIKRQLTAAYTPQQNGIAERKNRTLLEMVRCMITSKDIPKRFWPEAVNWANYVLNRSPAAALVDVTPEEAWSSTKPSVKHFRIFGCIAYAHVPDAQRKKLDNKSTKCIFLGVSEESKAYRLYNPVTKKIIISRDVVFAESEKWSWNEAKRDMPSQIEGSDDEVQEETQLEATNTSANQNQAEIGPVIRDSTNNASSSRLPEGRIRRPPAWLDNFDTSTSDDQIDDDEMRNMAIFGPSHSKDPVTYEDAAKYDVWRKAMDDEIQAIERNNTWELTDLPKECKVIGVKWIYKTKVNEKGGIEKYKARLVAKGYAQKYGIDYKEVFAPVARWDTIRSLLAVAALKEWNVFQLDVKSAFLHGELLETVYVEQPLGYVKEGSESKVYKLHKALYGLK
jgi:hypothetical protein